MTSKTESPLGPALRALRRDARLTLADVAKRTGLTASTLSRVENGEATLTYDKLVRLAEGLAVDIAEFFRPALPSQRRGAVTARRSLDRSDGTVVDTPRYLYRYLHTDISGKRLVPIVTERLLRNREEFGEYHRHAGEEFIFVLQGAMDLHTEFYAPMRVETGQSAYIDSTMGHAYIAVGDAPCRILAVMTAPDSEPGADSHLTAIPDDRDAPRTPPSVSPRPTAKQRIPAKVRRKRSR